jgi:hypothetical protein
MSREEFLNEIINDIEHVREILDEALEEPSVAKMNMATSRLVLTSLVKKINNQVVQANALI